MRSQFPEHLDNVWVYLRKSREDREAEERAKREGRHEIETLSRHRRTILELAHKYNHNITAFFEEVVGGEYISERPEVQRLLQGVEDGDADAVWCMDLDRLGRGDMEDQGRILRIFKDSATLILTPDKMYDLSDEIDEELTEFKTFMARRELKIIRKRLQGGRVRSVKDGKYIGTRPPFGYDVTRDLILVPNKDADTVRLIFDLYVNQRLGCSRIAQYLNQRGIKSPEGMSWYGEMVLPIIRNEVYAGWIVWRKMQSDKRKNKYRKRPESEHIRAKGLHESLIDEAMYATSVTIRKRRSNAPVTSKHTVTSPLSGLIVCAQCGKRMVRRPYSKQAAHLICPYVSCSQKSTRLSIVEARVLQALEDWLYEFTLTIDEVAAAMSPVLTNNTDHERTLRGIDDEIRRVETQRDNLHDLLEQKVYDTDTYLSRNQKLLAELADLRQRRSTVEGDIRKAEQLQTGRLNVIPRVRRVLDAYRMTSDPAVQNELLKTVLEKVVYNKEAWQKGEQFELILHPLV